MATPPTSGPPDDPDRTGPRGGSHASARGGDAGGGGGGDGHEVAGQDAAVGSRGRIRASVPEPVGRGFAERFGIDARALAVFRVALGLLVVSDLLLRAPEIRVFYTDAGVLPRAAHAELYPLLARASLHTLTGSTRGQALFFLLGGCLALALAVGYRTRLATVGTLALHASLYARNPYLLNGGDGLLVLALFFGLFLPLGARWSVDAVRRDRRGSCRLRGAPTAGPGPWRLSGEWIVGLATAALLLQLVVVYTANALFKHRSDAWTSGRAVQYALELEQFSVLLGPSLAAYPRLLVAINWLWLGMLWVAALLVLATGRLRVAVVAAFAGAHLGMLATMRLGLFPVVVAAMLLLYLPAPVWNRLERHLEARSLPARTAGAVERGLGRLPPATSRSGVPPRVRRVGRTLAVVVLATALVASVVWPAAALGAAEGTAADRVVQTEDYTWKLFAPNTPTHVVWFVAPVRLESGAEIDALGGGPVDWSEPADAAETYPSPLWHRYLTDLRWAGEAEHRPLAAYLCREAGTATGGEPTEVAIYAVRRPIDAVGGGDVEREELHRQDCSAVD